MLTEELGAAECIKSRVNRLSVKSAIVSIQERLKRYRACPPNGLAIFCGEVLDDEGKLKKLTLDFEPIKPIATKQYSCANRFHTEQLHAMLHDEDPFGFIIMDGLGILFAVVAGSKIDVLQQLSVDLPKKHGRGGQSALRFARRRVEARRNYVRKASELASHHFLTGEKPNVKGIFLAGSADLKSELVTTGLFDARLTAVIVDTFDICYGGKPGLHEAIRAAAPSLTSNKLKAEQSLIQEFFTEISTDSGKYAIGVADTLTALNLSAVQKILVWEDLDVVRRDGFRKSTGEKFTVCGVAAAAAMKDPDVEIVSSEPLVDWLVEHAAEFGAAIVLVSDASHEGSQFARGFGGVGAILRWKVELDVMDAERLAVHASAPEVSDSFAACAGVDGAAGVEVAEPDEEIDFI